MIHNKHLKSLSLPNYNNIFKFSNGKTIKCYSKKQMNFLYGKNNYIPLGELTNKNREYTNNCIGDIELSKDMVVPITSYKKHNRFIYSEKGYLKCSESENFFVVLLKNMLIYRLLTLFIIFVLILGGSYLYNSNILILNNDLNIDQNAEDWTGNKETITQNNSTSGTQIPGFGSMTIPANTTNINVSLGNPEINSCYFKLTLMLEDGTELFKSELIPPGKGFYNIELSKPLETGEYNAVLKYETFNLDTSKPMNGANVKFTLNVQ